MILVLSIVVLILSLAIIPKKMGVHSVSFAPMLAYTYVALVLAAEDEVDWILYILQRMKYSALAFGISLGDCCVVSGPQSGYNTEIFDNSGIAILLLVFIWLMNGIAFFYHKQCTPFAKFLTVCQYYFLTGMMCLTFHLTYASMNTLYNYQMKGGVDAVNTTFSIFIFMAMCGVTLMVWLITYNLKMDKFTEIMEEPQESKRAIQVEK